MKLYFSINFGTRVGQRLVLRLYDEKNEHRDHNLTYSENNNWITEIDYFSKSIQYKYLLVSEQGDVLDEEIPSHNLILPNSFKEFVIFDQWNLKNFPENYLTNKILHNRLQGFKPEKLSVVKKQTHLFRIEAPLYHPNWTLVMIGNVDALGNWDAEKAVELKQTDYGIWEAGVEIPTHQTVLYKYAIKDKNTRQLFYVEPGENRWVFGNPTKDLLYVKADHYFKFNDETLWHSAGVAVPVFSLRTEAGFGVGEFSDIKKLGDWANDAKLSVIQILPINDTTANYTWTDSYPYAAISVYALHPQYLSIEKLEYALSKELVKEYQSKKAALNALSLIDYEQMISGKWKFATAVFEENKSGILKDKNFKKFIKDNEEWLMPYSAFCLLRDKYKTPNFNDWKTHKKFVAGKVATLYSPKHKDYSAIMLHAWVQYQLHLQLQDAVEYLHKLGLSVKGDLPIGIYRYSVEAWTEPELFGMDFQAGAPPDQFSDLGQNWEFPTYNWEVMKADGYQWWKKRFKVLEQYFDAMRIDHILGFFRIWRMPISATQGLLGYFYPAVPVTEKEFSDRQIPFSSDRYVRPFVNEPILWETFGEVKEKVQNHFFDVHHNGVYAFKPEYDTQRKLSNYFKKESWDWAEEKLISLAGNVLFLTEETDNGTVYHPRFNIAKTSSYQYLPDWEKAKLSDVYNDYFFKRQDGLWYQKAMEKLPALLNSTTMLICGEDLGLVPDSVPVVMDKLAITALKVQRMPSDNIRWYDPKNASYLNVVTASSHDSSTLRQWWHEDRNLTQKYFNNQLGQYGTAPWDLTPDLSEMIMKQHLFTEAMLAIFPIQEFLATDQELMNPDMDEERINNPAVFPHYWRYRMHLKLEDLKEQTQFNEKIAGWIEDSGRY
ncbi:4-alpha-glucanotransferase [Epilithonimonas tenax]|uniref:4-alpha-glucanotransferase n=1 Tax=Epilithonimonas tenax TaxID=191577 RepID=UPI000486E955|nr:4-alpha-glucanotransferase [Epilithonimonas tenax]